MSSVKPICGRGKEEKSLSWKKSKGKHTQGVGRSFISRFIITPRPRPHTGFYVDESKINFPFLLKLWGGLWHHPNLQESEE